MSGANEERSEKAENEEKVKNAEKVPPKLLLPSLDLNGLAKAIEKGQFKKVIVMAGAGISVSAGIPDFRTPGTGLYDNLQKYKLERPEDIFTLSFFRDNPEPFNHLAKELYPGQFQPTATHHFIKLLSDKGILQRCYTQNIDGLEFLAGVPRDKVFQAHGGFNSAHCIDCEAEADPKKVKATILSGGIPTCEKALAKGPCKGLVKPDIVFFGESLPRDFSDKVQEDFPSCDLLITMGTSLQVMPFAGLVNRVENGCVRVLVNREMCGHAKKTEDLDDSSDPWIAMMKALSIMTPHPDDTDDDCKEREEMQAMIKERLAVKEGFLFLFPEENTRDVFINENCDTAVQKLCSALKGWDLPKK